MNELSLNATKRGAAGKGVARRLRTQGRLPAVIYGHRVEHAIAAQLDTKELLDLLREGGRRALIKLRFSDDPEADAKTVIIKELQFHPITQRLLHADLLEIRMDEKIHIEVPVVIRGHAIGQDNGGVLQMGSRTIRVECLPSDIPEKLEVDVAHLDIGHSVHLSDLTLPAGVTSIEDTNPVLASVVTVRAVVEEKTPEQLAAEQAAAGAEAEAKPEGGKPEAAAVASGKGAAAQGKGAAAAGKSAGKSE